MHTLSRAQALRLFCLTTIFLLLALLQPGRAAEGGPSEHMDIEFGGPGTEAGKFVELRDITFDNENRLYALDGGEVDAAGNRKGNFRVQRFDARGKFQAQFSVWDEGLGKSNEPSRIAVDSRGQVYVSQPKAGIVQQFSAAGTLIKKIEVPFAKAVGHPEKWRPGAGPGDGRAVLSEQMAAN